MNQKPVIVAKARWQENRKHDDNMHKDQRDFREDRRPVNRITSGNLVYINSNMNYNR